MTEPPSQKFRWWQKLLLALGILAGLGVLTLWFLTTATFWQQVGWRLVAALQNRVNGAVTVEKISGNLITGMVFSNVKISRPQGDIIRVSELEVSLSLLSFFKLQPVIRTLAFRQPEVFLSQDAAGVWNVTNLFKKMPPPPFSHIHLSNIRVEDGVVQVDRSQQHLTFQNLDAQLNVTIQAPARPQLQVLVHQGSLGVTSPPYPRLQAKLALTYSSREIQFKQTNISLAGFSALSLQGKLANLATVPELAIHLEIPELSGTQIQKLYPKWPQELPLAAVLEATGPLTNLHLAGKGALKDCQWHGTGQWQQETPAAPEFNLVLNFQNLTGAVLTAWKHQTGITDGLTPLQGALTLNGAGLLWPPANLEARLDLQPFSHRQAKVETATLTVKLDGETRQNVGMKLHGNFGRLEAEANGHILPLTGFKTAIAGDLKITAVQVNPAVLLGGKAPQGSLELKYTGDFQVPPALNWSQARLAGKLQASGKLKDYAFQDLSAQGSWEAGELRLNPARLVMGNLKAEAQGRLSLANADLKLALDLLPPGPWPLLPADLKGQFRADATVKGAWPSLSYNFSFQGRSLSWRHLALASVQGQTAGIASRQTFTISHFDVLAQKFSTPVGLFGQIQGQGRTQGTDLVFNLKAQQSPGQSGALAGVAAWEKDLTRVRINQFRWGPPDFQIAAVEPLTLTIAPGTFEITPLRLRYHQTLLTLAGRVTREDVAGQLKLDNLQLADVARLVPQVALLHGTVNAQADISGTGQAPIIKGYLNLASGLISKYPFDSFQTNWLYQNNILTLNGFMVEKPEKARLTWQGSTPLNVSLRPWFWRLPDSGLQLRVSSDNLNLSLFAGLIPGVSASDGPMNLQAQISGSFSRPLLAGSLRYGPGSLTIRESGAPLAIEPGEVRLEGDRLVVPRFVFRSGDGQGEITGGARLANFNLRDVHLNLTAADLLIIRREGSRAVANGQVSLQGSWPDFRAEGRLTVNDAQFRLSFFRSDKNKEIILLPRVCPSSPASASSEGTAAVERSFTVNLVIDIPGGVWLRDKDLNGELEGQIKVLRQPPGPRYLGGWVRAKEGAIFAINNKIFSVEKAALTFPGEPHKPILVDARASRQVDDYTLYVAASGPVDNPRTRLESNPPLPSRDQLSLLVFDHLADKMTREEYVTATQKAMGVLGSLTAQKLKSLLGEDLPLLGDVSPTTTQEAVGVGKKLSKDITVSYERKLNPLQGEDVNQIRLDYKFHKYFSAESQLGRKNTGGDIFFNIDF